jgi:hypothetical protein
LSQHHSIGTSSPERYDERYEVQGQAKFAELLFQALLG